MFCVGLHNLNGVRASGGTLRTHQTGAEPQNAKVPYVCTADSSHVSLGANAENGHQ